MNPAAARLSALEAMADNPAVLFALGGTAAACAAALLLGGRRAAATVKATQAAVASGGTFLARLTGYWPFTARPDERQMEGGHKDRKGRLLHTLEQHRENPGQHPYVAVSGDDAIFPYGQRLMIDEWPGLIFRVVDTGGHFRGSGKLYRVFGREPLDICVNSSRTKIIPNATATIVRGDHFDKPDKEIALSKFEGQSVLLGAGRPLFHEEQRFSAVLDLLDAEVLA